MKGFINNLRGSAEPRIRYKKKEFDLKVSQIKRLPRSPIRINRFQIEPFYPHVMVMRDTKEKHLFWMVGNTMPLVKRFPVLPSSLSSVSDGSLMNRMTLAKWLVDGDMLTSPCNS